MKESDYVYSRINDLGNLMRNVASSVIANGVIEKARSMVENLHAAFGAMLRKSSWLVGEPRKVALRKLGKVRYTLGYTEDLPNASAVEAIYGQLTTLSERAPHDRSIGRL
ncbi:hypothetical protein V5799_004547 [Amblyomma americanum]|uniref:Uncharacterized protein n=1 Tax=Amblyomma americanum TaxID=6943 RepID=A0AAQ4D5T1_AMBAM